MATVTNLRETLKEIAAAIDTNEDVVMLYLAGPSDRDGSLQANLPPLELVPLSPAVLNTLFDEAGIVWRIVIVSSCRGEGFIEALKSDTTIVLVAAEDAGGGCAGARDATRIGTTLFGDALTRADSLQKALEAAQAAVGGSGGAPGAKLHIGPEIAAKIRELDRRRATRGASRTV
jgi:Peptidase C13 family